MAIIQKINVNGAVYNLATTAYTTCDTGASTVAKTITLNGLVIEAGVTIHVKFNNENTATNPTLTIAGAISSAGVDASTTAIPIMRRGTTRVGKVAGANSWSSGEVVSLTYDGTNWIADYNGDTTYTFTGGTNKFTYTPAGGTAQDVTITPSIANNITGTGTRTADYLVKFSGENTVTNLVGLSDSVSTQTQNTKFLREDGTWATPSYTGALSIQGTSPVDASTSNGITTISLNSAYGDTQNPYGSKTKNYVLAAPSNANGAPTFRKLVAADLPAGSTSATGIVQLSAAADDTSKAATAKSVYDLSQTVNSLLATSDALVYQGTLSGASSNTNGGTYTPAANKGDTYKVDTAGYVNGIYVEAGDMLICNTDGTAAATSSTYNTVAGKWDIVQANLTNAVISDGGEAGYIAKFKGANTIEKGPLISTGGTGFLKEDGSWATPTNSRDPGYGKITPANNDSVVTGLTGNTTQIAAGTYNENLKLTGANKWIVLASASGSSNGNDEIKFGHLLSGVTANSYGDSGNQTPNYGDTFNVPYITVDAAGHITAISTHTVKIPAVSDTKVSQVIDTSSDTFPLLFSEKKTSDTTATVTTTTKRNNSIYVKPSAGEIHATEFYGGGTHISSLAASAVKSALSIDNSASTVTFLHQTGAWKTLSLDVSDSATTNISVSVASVDTTTATLMIHSNLKIVYN